MDRFFEKSVESLFYLLFFLVPLVLFPKTSEIFEFNKMILTYALTVLIIASWIIKMVLAKKIIFRRTVLDIPLLLFSLFQFLSFLVSIDHRTSLLGYYSRFHGGLLSTVSYLLLYLAYVSNMDRQKTLNAIRFMLYAAILVSIYGILEHLGIDKDIWVQDVQNRVFSTLGQPNWLAAWIVALVPLTWALGLNSKINPFDKLRVDAERSRSIKNQKSKLHFKIQNYWIWVILSSLFFLTLLYTKSRSGILGFTTTNVIFWATSFFITRVKHKESNKTLVKTFVIFNLSFVILALASGTPWTPSLKTLLTPKTTAPIPTVGPALETGGTESGQIRKIVWNGAVDVWRHYPILGSGVETFAFAYYKFRPIEHNMVSEWDYLYNKAHNEYLNFAATTGTLGITSYLFLIAAMGFVFFKNFQFSILPPKVDPALRDNSQLNSTLKINKLANSLEIGKWPLVILALAAGWASILVTNFFGFSVVPIALLFFLYPAMAVTLELESKRVEEYKSIKLSNVQILAFFISCSLALLLLYSISRYWYSDVLYAKGKLENDSQNPVTARKILLSATKLSPHESIFWDELAQSTADIAVSLQEQQAEDSQKVAELASSESTRAISLSPANVNLKRSRASIFVKLSTINPDYLLNAVGTLEEAVKLAPTDAKLSYNLALAYVRIGERGRAIETLIKTVKARPIYREARYALALLYLDEGETLKAREELEYILTRINPQDTAAQKELEELEK